MCAEAITVLRAVAADSSLTVGILRSPHITLFGTNQDASTIMHRSFDWKLSRISMFEMEAVPQSCIP
jgi:hypothetical protein